MSKKQRADSAKIGAAIWLLILVAAIGAGAVVALMKINVTGTISADVFVRNVVYPLALAVAGILTLGSYVAMRVLWGEKTTDSALSRLTGIIQEAGAAKELREELERRREE